MGGPVVSDQLGNHGSLTGKGPTVVSRKSGESVIPPPFARHPCPRFADTADELKEERKFIDGL